MQDLFGADLGRLTALDSITVVVSNSFAMHGKHVRVGQPSGVEEKLNIMSELGTKLANLSDADRVRLYRDLVDRFGESSPRSVQELVLVYEKASGVDPGALLRVARSRLPAHERPTRFIATDSLPRTPHGKLDRRGLPGLVRVEQPSADQDIEAGADDVMSSAIATFSQVLGTATVGPDSNFFELGGHSLLAVECILAFEKKTGERISITEFLNHPTPRGIAAVLKEHSRKTYDYIYPVSKNRSGVPVFVFSSSKLAYALKPRKEDWTVYGVQLRWRDENDREIHYRSMEELAGHIAAEIRQICGEREFVLAGSSFSAMVALEVARQLQADGFEPKLLVLIDPSLFPKLRTWLELDLQSRGQLKEGQNPYVRWLLFNNPLRAQFWRRLVGSVSKRRGIVTGSAGSPDTRKQSRGYEDTRAAALRRDYRPLTYKGPAALLAGAETSWLVCKDWRPLLGKSCMLHLVDADHGGILRDPVMSDVVVPIVIAEADSALG